MKYTSAKVATEVRCFLFVETWDYWPLNHIFTWKEAYCSNIVGWTVISLVPGWLLYPLTQQALRKLEDAAGLVGL
eukprot:3368472-Prymnesium_polylepis.1